MVGQRAVLPSYRRCESFDLQADGAPGIDRVVNAGGSFTWLDGTSKPIHELNQTEVIERCDGCIASHAEGATRAGATRQEAAVASKSLLMGGGPSTIYGPRAYTAFREFTEN